MAVASLGNKTDLQNGNKNTKLSRRHNTLFKTFCFNNPSFLLLFLALPHSGKPGQIKYQYRQKQNVIIYWKITISERRIKYNLAHFNIFFYYLNM